MRYAYICVGARLPIRVGHPHRSNFPEVQIKAWDTILTSVVVSVSVMSIRVVVSRAFPRAVIPDSSTASGDEAELSDVASCMLVLPFSSVHAWLLLVQTAPACCPLCESCTGVCHSHLSGSNNKAALSLLVLVHNPADAASHSTNSNRLGTHHTHRHVAS